MPFRLTPNLAELVTSIGVSGPFTACMVATARCLATPSFKVNAFLRAIMRDEIISWHKVSYRYLKEGDFICMEWGIKMFSEKLRN